MIMHFSLHGLECCGLFWCFYQLFRLSFWRHPFTAEHPLLRHWCNAFSKSDGERKDELRPSNSEREMDFKLHFVSLWRKKHVIKKVIFCALLGHPSMMETEVSHTAEIVHLTCCRWLWSQHFDIQIQCYNGLHFYMLVIALHSFVYTTKYIAKSIGTPSNERFDYFSNFHKYKS